jgi:hypothetical protein
LDVAAAEDAATARLANNPRTAATPEAASMFRREIFVSFTAFPPFMFRLKPKGDAHRLVRRVSSHCRAKPQGTTKSSILKKTSSMLRRREANRRQGVVILATKQSLATVGSDYFTF